MAHELREVGWREWVALPALGIPAIKAKIDTGARSSALHAVRIERVRRGQKRLVRFQVHPRQRDTSTVVEVQAPVIDYRVVRSSGGHQTLRPVVEIDLELLGERWLIELTLVSRAGMGFRMLLGRQAIRGRFVVNPAVSYLGGRPGSRGPRR